MGKQTYLNMESMATFVQRFNYGDAAKNKEAMLLLLLELKEKLDAVKMQKKAAVEKAKRVVAVADGAGAGEGGAAPTEASLVVWERELQLKVQESKLWEQHARMEMTCKAEAMTQAIALQEKSKELAMKEVEVKDTVAEADIRRRAAEIASMDAAAKKEAEIQEAALTRRKAAANEEAEIQDIEMARKKKALKDEEELHNMEMTRDKKAATKRQAQERANAKKQAADIACKKKNEAAAAAIVIDRLEREAKAKVDREKLLQQAAIQREKEMQDLEDTKAARRLAREKERHEQDLAMAAERQAFINGLNNANNNANDHASDNASDNGNDHGGGGLGGITIWAYFAIHKKSHFRAVKVADQAVFLQKVTDRAIQLFHEKWPGAADPNKVDERRVKVYSFPRHDEVLVKLAFGDVYRAHVGGSAQAPLNFGA